MIEPYYEQGGITIYHANCLEVLAQLSRVALVLGDPPYGIEANTKSVSSGRSKLFPSQDYAPVAGIDEVST